MEPGDLVAPTLDVPSRAVVGLFVCVCVSLFFVFAFWLWLFLLLLLLVVVVVVVVVVVCICRLCAPPPSFCQSRQLLVRRMGLAPGFRSTLRLASPLGHHLDYGCRTVAIDQQMIPSSLNRVLLTNANHTGSDMRIATCDILNHKAFPRQSVEAPWWSWDRLFTGGGSLRQMST